MLDNIQAPLSSLAEPQTTGDDADTSTRAALAGDLNSRLAAARPRLARRARLYGATADEAEDIAQETLLAAWRSLDNLRAADRFDAWLDGICRNICRHTAHLAAGERERIAPLAAERQDGGASALDLLSASDDDPLDTLTHQELVTLLDSALGQLNAAAREAVRLRYLADLPMDEAAARLGLSINTLEARLSRARKQLRAALNGPLRERAEEFGLALAPAGESGWRDSRLWCHFCGQSRMQGILEDAPDGSGRMVLRCPICWREHGIIETNMPAMPAIAGLRAFKPAMKRMMRVAFEHIAPALLREAPCFICGQPMRARVLSGVELPAVGHHERLYDNFFYIATPCHKCDVHVTGAAAVAGRDHPDIMRFLLERERFIVEPEALVTYQSSPAIRFSLLDLPSGDRMVYFADPQTLAIRGVMSE